MSAAKKIRKANLDVVIIFITKLGNMAIKGYEVDALDFIVKPVEYYAFELRMIKALNYLKKHQKYKLTISPISQGKKVICLSDLYYVEVQGRHLTYHTKDGDFVANGRLYEAEKVLDGDIFVYCNRYCIVNISYVRGFENGFVNVNGALLSVTKGKKEELMSALAKRSVSI